MEKIIEQSTKDLERIIKQFQSKKINTEKFQLLLLGFFGIEQYASIQLKVYSMGAKNKTVFKYLVRSGLTDDVIPWSSLPAKMSKLKQARRIYRDTIKEAKEILRKAATETVGIPGD